MPNHQPAAPILRGSSAAPGGCVFKVLTVADAVERAAAGKWDVPEFQREFVWNPDQVCALADSLWRDYPIGTLLLWQRQSAGQSPLWIADGQQRLTALCLLTGTAPSWFSRKPEQFRARMRRNFVIQVDPAVPSGLRFVAADDADSAGLIPAARLLDLDPNSRAGASDLERIIRGLKDRGACRELDDEELYGRLARVCMIGRRELAAVIVNHGRREDILEIFARLNSRGMRFRTMLLKMMMEEIPAAIRGMKARFQA